MINTVLVDFFYYQDFMTEEDVQGLEKEYMDKVIKDLAAFVD